MQPARLVVAVVLVALVPLVVACTKSGEGWALAAQDLQSSGASFDPGAILDPASMQDEAALDAGAIEQFLQQTPYGGPSFLAAYSSNGVPASDAIAAAAQRYTLDPIVFLVRAEMDQGLVASSTYPTPASRVEYAFGCGCSAPGSCDPTYAGFDVQVDCLGAALRDALDAVAATGQTAGGWGPNLASTTLDGVAVTPRDDSWQEFAGSLGYSPPGGAPGPAAWIGDACLGSGVCSYDGTEGTCATQFPGGLCTLACTASCPTSSAEVQTFCADFGSEGGFCLAVCNPSDPQCRAGYVCETVKQFGDTAASADVCFPM